MIPPTPLPPELYSHLLLLQILFPGQQQHPALPGSGHVGDTGDAEDGAPVPDFLNALSHVSDLMLSLHQHTGTYLPEYQLSIHVHGQVAEMQQHLVRGQLLFNDVVPIDHHDGHADKEVEIVSLQGESRGWSTAGGGTGLTQPPALHKHVLREIFCSFQICLVVHGTRAVGEF